MKQNYYDNPSFVDIGGMPSNFHPYTFKELYIRPFTIKELKLISSSITLKDKSQQIRAVDLVISEPVQDLTIFDYYYVLEWLKTFSFTKVPKIVEWQCDEKYLRHKTTGEFILNDPASLAAFNIQDSENYELVDCDTLNSESIHVSKLETLQLPDTIEPLPNGFDYPRVRNMIEIEEAQENPELRLIVKAAQWVSGSSFDEKMKILEEQINLDLFKQALAVNDLYIHGIKETTTLHCRKCRIEHPYTLTMNTDSFFQ